jgi:alkaline phosphatase D
LVYTLFAAYVPAFIYNLTHTAPYDIISDDIDIVTREINDDDAYENFDSRYADATPPESPIAELDVQETIVVNEKGPQVLKTLATGLPSPTSLFWTTLTFLVNLALVLMTVDLVYRGVMLHPSEDLSMARVGYVSISDARVLVREADAGKYPITVSYRNVDPPMARGMLPGDTAWKTSGKIDWLDESTDFTGTLTLSGLKPDTKYQWAASNNHTGHFTTPPRAGHISNRADNAGSFTFVHSSCLKNNFPYVPFRHPLSNPGLQHFSRAIQNLQAQFMVFLGDFIYIDVPGRFGSGVEDYRQEYRRMYASPDWKDATKDLPWIHVYDDHEVANDWDGNTTGVFNAAYDPYALYHTSVNPPAVRPDESWFSFTQGPASFFMIDTRRYRSPNDKSNGSDPFSGEPTKTMLGEAQLADLLAWLKRPEPSGVRWKILISSIPFTKNWWFGAQDTWRGYLGERQIILEAMWDVGLRSDGIGVVVLSGDRHEFAATAFPPPPDGKEEVVGLAAHQAIENPFHRKDADSYAHLPVQTKRKRWPLSATVHEFSASPLNMFYAPIRTYKESSTSADYVSDVCIKYLPDGNSKFGAVSISSPSTSEQSILHYRLFVDGEEAWSYTITTPPTVGGGGRSKDAIWG